MSRISLRTGRWQALPDFPRLPIGFFFGILIPVPQLTHPHNRARTRSATRPLSQEIIRILRFGVVGGFGTLLNALLMWGLLSIGSTLLGLNPSGHRVATAAALVAWMILLRSKFPSQLRLDLPGLAPILAQSQAVLPVRRVSLGLSTLSS